MKKLVLIMALMFGMVSMAQEAKKPEGEGQRPTIEQRVDKMIATLDKDKDGKLDKTELTDMMKSRGQMGGMRGENGEKGAMRGKGKPMAPPME